MSSPAEISAVIDALRRAPEIVLPLIRESPGDILRRRPASGTWSIHEHACHLAVVHPLFSHRLDMILSDPAPVITPYDPGSDDAPDGLMAMDLNDSLERFARDRSLMVQRLLSLHPSDWEKTAEHAEYARYSVLIMFRHLALHDFFHSYRIEELVLSRDWGADTGQSPR